MKRALKFTFSLLVTVALLVIIGNLTAFYFINRGNNFFLNRSYKKAKDSYTLAYKISKQKSIKDIILRTERLQKSSVAYKDGLKYLQLKKYENAYNSFLKVIPEDNNYKDAQDRLPGLEELIQVNRDIARSIEQYKKGLEYYYANNLETALEYLTRVINEDPNYEQAQGLIDDIRKRLNKDEPQKTEQDRVAVPPRTVTFKQPVRKPLVTGNITIKPYGYDFGNDFRDYQGNIDVEIWIVNTDTAKSMKEFSYLLKPGETNPPIFVFDKNKNDGMEPKSDYRVKIYYNKKLVEVHNMDYYGQR